MLVKDQMTHNPICGRADMPAAEAAELMSQNNFRHLPIVDEGGKLVGLVTRPAVTRAISTSGGHLGQHEIKYILTKIKVRDIMVTQVITISPDTPIEEAARVLADTKISCLPVVQDGRPIGIITDSDLFVTMVNLLGARRQGARITVLQPDRAGEVARISKAVADKGGYLSVFVTYPTAEAGTWASVLKVTDLPKETLVETLKLLPEIRIQDVRETG